MLRVPGVEIVKLGADAESGRTLTKRITKGGHQDGDSLSCCNTHKPSMGFLRSQVLAPSQWGPGQSTQEGIITGRNLLQ